MPGRVRNLLAASFAAWGLAGGIARAAEGRPTIAGWWHADVPFLPMQLRTNPPPFKPEAAAQFAAAFARPGVSDYCAPLKFAGYNFGIGGELEIRETPSEVILVAHDIRLERHIRLDGRPGATPPPGSGHSSGAWKSGVLEMKTVELDRDALFPLPTPGAPGLGAGAEVVERMFLQSPDSLVIEVETTAPAILQTPDRRRFVYSRVSPAQNSGWTFCAHNDRTVDRVTGQQRFDMTPPPDLPPPPP